jgi:hypothetical protein
MALPPDYPDYTAEDVALATMREYVTKGTDEQLMRRLNETPCQDESGGWYYRPYFAAMRALASNPRWLESGEGAKFRDLDHALSTLASDQAAQDATLGLIVPAHLNPLRSPFEAAQKGYGGAVPMAVIPLSL